MNVLVVEPGYMPYEKEINGYEEERAVIGGPIQIIYPFEEQVGLLCNEESMFNGSAFNRSVPGGYGGVFGTFIVCGLTEDDYCSLTPEQVEKYKKFFSNAEILIKFDGNNFQSLRFPAEIKKREKDSHGHKHSTPER